ncbi:4-aminobutyrate--2-oxoglutarate transaminase [Frondihabitans cladoniiphilus]|uniref:4-aminobutyrate--2-oxoglutarate transaminase n=1 Tax=Frondihabitans cladoniiphilus TaxID=715785 RepID=UPI003CD0B93B
MTTPARQPLTQQRRVVTSIPGPKSVAMQERRLAAVGNSVGAVLPTYIERAEGSILLDVDGNQLLDFGSGIAVNALGHGRPEIADAVRAQLDDFAHTCFTVSPYEEYVAVCEQLNAHTPGDFEKRSVLFSSGSEAVENAVKIARSTTGRQGIVAFDYGYHGRTYMAMALTAKALPYKSGFAPFPAEVYRAPFPYSYRWPTGEANTLEEAFAAFVDSVHTQVGEKNVAAVIFEPILGEAGFIVPPAGYWKRVADWCALHGILVIADEVQTGFCRTGDWFASSYEGIEPDLVVTGKAIANGYPLAGVTGRASILDAVPKGGLGGTYAGNGIACAAALATMKIMDEVDAPALARTIGTKIVARLTALQQKYDVIGEIRGRGAMIGIEFVLGAGDKTPHPEMAAAFVAACHREGLLVMVTGDKKQCIRLLPPLTISDELLDDALDVMERAVATAA